MKKVIEGSHAIAEAVRLCEPKVIAAYPITPQTHIVERLAEMVADGELDAEYLNVESEHSALSVCIGAQATGVRTFTATASQGLALMHEILFIASGMRLPIVMVIVNRSLSSPLNIWCDWSDSIAERDSGWLQFYCETTQEVFDTIIQAYRISEHERILLPSMVCIDGFFLSHVYEPVDIAGKKRVKGFLPGYSNNIDLNKPVTQGSWAGPDYFQEFKKQQQDAMHNANKIIKNVNNDFARRFRRKYGDGLIETYNMKNARFAIISMGSVCGTIKHVLEHEKNDMGLIRIKTLRPFPLKELNKIIEEYDIKGIGVLEKDISLGSHGALWSDVSACLDNIPVSNFIAGLGGKDIKISDVKKVFSIIRKKVQGIYWV